jgi:hypothetical protein
VCGGAGAPERVERRGSLELAAPGAVEGRARIERENLGDSPGGDELQVNVGGVEGSGIAMICRCGGRSDVLVCALYDMISGHCSSRYTAAAAAAAPITSRACRQFGSDRPGRGSVCDRHGKSVSGMFAPDESSATCCASCQPAGGSASQARRRGIRRSLVNVI